jgi:hypothetical protein
MAKGFCSRILLVVFNTLFFACGALLLSFGIAGIADPAGVAGFISSVPGVKSMAVVIDIPAVIVSSAVFMIVLGSIMLVFGFLGCAGAACTVKPLLFFYWFLLILIILAEIALIIYAAVSPSLAQNQIKNVMYTSLHDNFATVTLNVQNKTVTLPSNIVSVAWVSMQFEVPCCGVTNYTDYENFVWNRTYTLIIGSAPVTINATVPPSCCTLNQKTVPKSMTDFVDLPGCLQGQVAYNQVGCYKAVYSLAQEYSYIPIIICSIVIAIEVVCMIAAIHLWRMKAVSEKA